MDWAGIVGLRNVLVHGYFAIDWQTVWRVTRRDLPALRARIEVLLRELEDEGPR